MSGQYPEATLPNEDVAHAMESGIISPPPRGTGIWSPSLISTEAAPLSPDVEYIIYVEKPGPVDVRFDAKHNWDVAWINPIDGEKHGI